MDNFCFTFEAIQLLRDPRDVMRYEAEDSHRNGVLNDLNAGLDAGACDALICQREDNVLDDSDQDGERDQDEGYSFLLDQLVLLQA